MNTYKLIARIGFLSLVLGLSACADDGEIINQINQINAGLTTRYDVTVTNVTANQLMTPLAVVIHKMGYKPWEFGEPASTGLEMLAEGGSPTLFLQEATSDTNVMTNMASAGPTMPGISSTVSLSLEHSHDIYLSFASMFADTNDAFTGLKNLHIGDLKVGESKTQLTHVFDAGTEANTELANSIPGPSSSVGGAGGFSGEPRDAAKDFVSIHPGIVGNDELPSSALDESKRWLNYGSLLKVTRIE